MSLILGAMALALAAGTPLPPVDWTGPDECPSRLFEENLRGYLDQVVPETRLVRVMVTVRDGKVWTVTVVMVDSALDEVTRQFEGDGCGDVSEAAALVVAMAIDPSIGPGSVPPPPPEPEPEPEPEPQLPAVVRPVSGTPAPTESAPVPRPSPQVSGDALGVTGQATPQEAPRRLRVTLRAHGGVAGLALPSVAPVFGAALGIRRGRAWVDVLGAYRLPTLVEAPGNPGVGGRLSRWAVGARGCFAPALRTVAFPLCVGLEAGQVVGRGEGLQPNRVDRLPWVAPVAGAGLLWSPIPRLGLGLEAGVAVPLLRHTYEIEGFGPVFEMGSVALTGLATVEVGLR